MLAFQGEMFTDRDFYRPVVSSALDAFGAETLSVLLNVRAGDLSAWASGRSRPPTNVLLQIIDLMRRKGAEERTVPQRGKPMRVLVAISPAARNAIAEILSSCPVEFASTMDEGIDALRRQSYSHVVIGSLFAESQMFEFAQQVRRLRPDARVLCVKAAGRPLSRDVCYGLDAAAREIGCEGFFDLTGGDTPQGFEGVFEELLAHFRPAKEPPAAVVGRLREAVQELRETA